MVHICNYFNIVFSCLVELNIFISIDILLSYNLRLAKIKAWIDEHDPGSVLIPFSGVMESDLAALDTEAKEQYLKDNPGASR